MVLVEEAVSPPLPVWMCAYRVPIINLTVIPSLDARFVSHLTEHKHTLPF